MGFFRFLAIAFLVLALLFLGGDAVTSLERGEVVMRGLSDWLVLAGCNPADWLEHNLPGGVASAAETVMSWPAWATLGVFGLILGALSWGRGDDGYESGDNWGDGNGD